MAKIIQYLPELEGDEQIHVAQILKPMTEEQARQFASVYRQRRRDPMTVLLLTLVVFAGVGGVNRFYLDQIGMGILFILTGGLCLVGSIIDAVNYRSLAFEYNRKQADEVAGMIRGASPAASDY